MKLFRILKSVVTQTPYCNKREELSCEIIRQFERSEEGKSKQSQQEDEVVGEEGDALPHSDVSSAFFDYVKATFWSPEPLPSTEVNEEEKQKEVSTLAGLNTSL